MNRAANALIIAAYAAAFALLANMEQPTLDRLTKLAGFEVAQTAPAVSDEQAVTLALAATISNHRPPVLDRFEDHQDAEPAPEIFASLD